MGVDATRWRVVLLGVALMNLVLGCGEQSIASVQEAVATQSKKVQSTCSDGIYRLSSKPYDSTILMDLYAGYWVMPYRIETTDSESPASQAPIFKFEGWMPKARYMSFNFYSQESSDSSFGVSHRDFKTEKRLNNATGEYQEYYTVYFALEDYVEDARNYYGSKANVFAIPNKQGINVSGDFEFWIRIYVPEKGLDVTGGVGLPEVSVYDSENYSPMPCPSTERIEKLAGGLRQIPPPAFDGKIDTYLSGAENFYLDEHTAYTLSTLNFSDKKDRTYKNKKVKTDAAIFRIKPPTHPRTFLGQADSWRDKDVGYWSLCSAGAVSTMARACISDEAAAISEDGYVYFIIGDTDLYLGNDDQNSLERLAKKYGLNFLPRSRLLKPMLVYRNRFIREGFAGDLRKIPQAWPPRTRLKDPREITAERHLGEWAPKGFHCSKEELYDAINSGSSNVCGLKNVKLQIKRAGLEVPYALNYEIGLPRPKGVPFSKAKKQLAARFGTSSSMFLGRLVGASIEPELSKEKLRYELEIAKHFLGHPKLGIGRPLGISERQKIHFQSPDLVAARLISGELDFGIVTTLDFQWITNYLKSTGRYGKNLIKVIAVGGGKNSKAGYYKPYTLPKTQRTKLYANKVWFEEKRNSIDAFSIEALRGARLCTSTTRGRPTRQIALANLARWIDLWGVDPVGFFRKPGKKRAGRSSFSNCLDKINKSPKDVLGAELTIASAVENEFEVSEYHNVIDITDTVRKGKENALKAPLSMIIARATQSEEDSRYFVEKVATYNKAMPGNTVLGRLGGMHRIKYVSPAERKKIRQRVEEFNKNFYASSELHMPLFLYGILPKRYNYSGMLKSVIVNTP